MTGKTPTEMHKEQPQSLEEEDDRMPEEEADVHFDPIINLPEKVAVSSGEEDEEVLFSQRSKLYRFDSNQWKERGAGDIKILKHNTTKKVRILMRRDQTMKICCNHYINRNLTLQQVVNNDRSWSWFTPSDFSDEQAKPEKLCVKFKLLESAQQFKTIFEKCATSDVIASASENANVHVQKSLPLCTSSTLWTCGECLVENELGTIHCIACSAKKPEISSLKDVKVGIQKHVQSNSSICMWICEECLKENEVADIQCASCYASRPPCVQLELGSEQATTIEEPEASKVQADDCVIISVDEPSATQIEKAKKYMLPRTFYLYESKSECSGCRGCIDENGGECKSTVKESVASILSEHPASSVSESSGSSGSKSSTTQSKPPCSTTTSLFSGAQSGLSFADLASKSTGLTFADFASKSDSQGFGFKMAPFAVGNIKPLFNTKSEDGGGDCGEEENPEREADVHFKPLVTLPELPSISTGEEEEEAVFSHRAKLYRFDSNTKQWKERGVGDIKIKCHKKTGKARILMRRDQVLKICCNHYINGDMDIKVHGGNDCTLTWFTPSDFADEEDTKFQKLMVKFKHAETASDFKSLFMKFAQNCKSSPPFTSITSAELDSKLVFKPVINSSSNQTSGTFSSSLLPKAVSTQWTCDVCYLENALERSKCIACSAPRSVVAACSGEKNAASVHGASGINVPKQELHLSDGMSQPSLMSLQGLVPQKGGIELTLPLPNFKFTSLSEATQSQSGGFNCSQSLPIFKLPALKFEQPSVVANGGVQLGPLPSAGGVQLDPLPSAGGVQLGPLPSAGGVQLDPLPSAGGVQLGPLPSAGGVQLDPLPSAGGLQLGPLPSAGGVLSASLLLSSLDRNAQASH